MRIAIDIGHGMGNRSPGVYDPGAVAQGYQEHLIVAGMAKRLADDFRALGHEVLLTQGLLGTRDDTAKRWGAAVLISLHCNAGGGTGTEAYVDTRATGKAKDLAQRLVVGVSKATGLRNRGVKVKDFAVLKANPTDVLLELFFIDNPVDMKAYQLNVDRVELAIVNAFQATFGGPCVIYLPRKGIAVKTYKKVVIHTSEDEVEEYRKLAATLNDFIKIEDTTKDSWKEW